jgi:2,4-dienoyl-CoA reductase-like NADH-dependent reductase (Old Yellow Enzyme family)
MKAVTKLFSPMKIGKMELKNRIIMPAMGTNLANADGSVSEKLTNYYVARAKGGAGLIIIEITTVDSRAKTKPFPTGIWGDHHIPGWREMVKRIHADGAKVALQLAHPGRQGGHGSQLFAPSPIPCPFAKEVPKELLISPK